jgi:hypothetical protein
VNRLKNKYPSVDKSVIAMLLEVQGYSESRTATVLEDMTPPEPKPPKSKSPAAKTTPTPTAAKTATPTTTATTTTPAAATAAAAAAVKAVKTVYTSPSVATPVEPPVASINERLTQWTADVAATRTTPAAARALVLQILDSGASLGSTECGELQLARARFALLVTPPLFDDALAAAYAAASLLPFAHGPLVQARAELHAMKFADTWFWFLCDRPFCCKEMPLSALGSPPKLAPCTSRFRLRLLESVGSLLFSSAGAKRGQQRYRAAHPSAIQAGDTEKIRRRS